MKGSVVEKYRAVDLALKEHRKLSVGVLRAIEPVNLKEEKERFFREGKEPKFRYPVVFFSPKEIAKSLASLQIPEGELYDLYHQKVEELANIAHIIANRGKDEVIEYSLKVYGRPSSSLIGEAERILKRYKGSKRKTQVAGMTEREAKAVFEKALESYGIKGWVVEYSTKTLTTVMPIERKILVPANRTFSRNEMKRLVVHEIGVHVLRAQNGHTQPLDIFLSGFPRNTETEEGLAVYMEKLTGMLESDKLRDYAGRVLSIHYMLEGLSFSEVFHKMKEWGFDDEMAWTLTFRSFRGGGFTKDYLYLKGFMEIQKVAKKGKSLHVLYAGRVTHQYFEVVKMLMENGEINKPSFLPKGVRSLNKVENILKSAESFIKDVATTTRKTLVKGDETQRKLAHDIGSSLRKWRTALRSLVRVHNNRHNS